MKRTTSLAALVAALVLAPAAGAAPGQPTSMATSEQDCVEVNSLRVSSIAALQARVPAGWTVVPNAAGRGVTTFVDYRCEAMSVDGRPARPTTVSWATVRTRNAANEERRWTISHGSDNPNYVERLRKLGVTSRYLPDTTSTVGTDGSTVTWDTTYVDDREGERHSYRRLVVAPETGAQTPSPGGTFHFPREDGGAVRITYDNVISPATSPTVTERFAEGSLPRGLGIADITAVRSLSSLFFYRGSWTADLQVVP